MTAIEFTSKARRSFRKLPTDIRQRILTKLKWYAFQPNPLHFADYVSSVAGKIYRFRIGDYRVVFDWKDGKIIVTDVGPRDRIYKT